MTAGAEACDDLNDLVVVKIWGFERGCLQHYAPLRRV
jgi:hypothetical protein